MSESRKTEARKRRLPSGPLENILTSGIAAQETTLEEPEKAGNHSLPPEAKAKLSHRRASTPANA
jgi:hypothetical protein